MLQGYDMAAAIVHQDRALRPQPMSYSSLSYGLIACCFVAVHALTHTIRVRWSILELGCRVSV
jgi:hypothetical protein